MRAHRWGDVDDARNYIAKFHTESASRSAQCLYFIRQRASSATSAARARDTTRAANRHVFHIGHQQVVASAGAFLLAPRFDNITIYFDINHDDGAFRASFLARSQAAARQGAPV